MRFLTSGTIANQRCLLNRASPTLPFSSGRLRCWRRQKPWPEVISTGGTTPKFDCINPFSLLKQWLSSGLIGALPAYKYCHTWHRQMRHRILFYRYLLLRACPSNEHLICSCMYPVKRFPFSIKVGKFSRARYLRHQWSIWNQIDPKGTVINYRNIMTKATCFALSCLKKAEVPRDD